ncbi:MAG TPA: hypothetical protein GYA10_10530 [Alphaproteobacteria bacterium]|nr:hypothetical protein [Alphaproteobacteria bacterium]
MKFITAHLDAAGPDAPALPLLKALSVLRAAMSSPHVRRLNERQRSELLAFLVSIRHRLVAPTEPTRWVTYLNAAATAVMAWAGDARWPSGSAGVLDADHLLLAAEHELAASVIFNGIVARNLASRQSDNHVGGATKGST